MILGVAEFIILGLIFDWAFRKIKLPGLIGLLFLGVLIGPYVLGAINQETMSVSYDLRIMALIVILLRAGFEISRKTLSKVGIRAVMMSFIPCFCEVGLITLCAPKLLGITSLEAAMLGGVLAAVSPAVVVPLMIKFIKERRGERKGIPTLVMAGSSCDDAVAIVLATSFVGMYVGKSANIIKELSLIPVSVITGIAVGLAVGVFLFKLFNKFNPRATKRTLIVIGLSVFLLFIEKNFGELFPFSGLIAIMAIGFMILEKDDHMAHEISSKLGKIWVFAQLLLFILVGAQVNLPVALNAGAMGALVILIGLIGRSVGVQFCLIKTNLNAKERLFVAVSYLPKATVQAAIGGMPLAAMITAGKPTAVGELILAVAVLSILLTAPLGAVLITKVGEKCLSHNQDDETTNEMKAAAESK
jgi:NhaP-type Na+/H+ or K+/H+ antiporter